MRIGIVGHDKFKFTPETEAEARKIIRELLSAPNAELVSGHCPNGGVDIFAEEIAIELGVPMRIFAPKQQTWQGSYGFKARNNDIASYSDEVHVVVVAKYPPRFKGRKFSYCYHCYTNTHVKSGGCYTALRAKRQCKTAVWHIIEK